MKNRGGAGAGGEGSQKKPNHHGVWNSKKKKNEKRLGGRGGLSLEAFANAKSGPSGYNPSLIKKQREFYKNAKYIGKYMKSLKQESQYKDHPTSLRLEDVDGNEFDAKPLKKKKNKKKTTLQSIREDFEKKQAEQEKANLEREALILAKKKERVEAEVMRKASKQKMFKKTKSGQPVMKYRIEHLLEGLLQNPAN